MFHIYAFKIVIWRRSVLADFSGVSLKTKLLEVGFERRTLNDKSPTLDTLHRRCVFHWGLEMIYLNKVKNFLRDQNDQTERMKENETFLQIISLDSIFMVATNAFHDRFQIEFVDSFSWCCQQNKNYLLDCI